MPRVLTEATWPEVSTGALVLVPVGSTDQHGPHLPLDTDASVADAVARRAADLVAGKRPDQPVWVAPVVSYGASGEHQAFPGTCSIGTQALQMVVLELVRSICTWAGRVVLVNGHEAISRPSGRRLSSSAPKGVTPRGSPVPRRTSVTAMTRTPGSPRRR